MHELALADNLLDATSFENDRDLEQFYCVEIPVRPGMIYQFKIWHTEAMLVSILVKDVSAFLSMVNVNSKFNMKFYSRDFLYPYQELITEIRDISFQECGRLKGHYLVCLEIIDEAEEQKIHELFHANNFQH